MNIEYCKDCDRYIDADSNAEHFIKNKKCFKTREIMVNKSEYIELKASHERLKEAMPDVIALANLAYTPLTEKKTILECIQEDKRIVETAWKALKQAP